MIVCLMSKPTALVILDGYGIGEPDGGNAIYLANTPVMDELLKTCPNTRLSASGLDVGLPRARWATARSATPNIGAGQRGLPGPAQDKPRG